MNSPHLKTFDTRPSDKEFGPTVLIVDDDAMARTTLQLICENIEPRGSFRTLQCASIEEALQLVTEEYIDVMLLDKNVSGAGSNNVNGIEYIPEFLRIRPSIKIVMVTGSNDIDDVVQAMNYGAIDYLIKGCGSTNSKTNEYLCKKIKSASDNARMHQENIRINTLAKKEAREILVGSSPAIEHIKRQIEMVAESCREVLLIGETGTGKTTAAEMIHKLRQKFLKQHARPMVTLNMAAIPASMIEAELFGYEPGSFTDAKRLRVGLIELADHGTLFMDEIAEASLELQVKLLKVLVDKKITRLGGDHEITVNFRLVCATNRNLDKLVEEGKFRHELLMRIKTITLEMPSLDKRRDDIPEIVQSILPKCCLENNYFMEFAEIPKDFVEYLSTHKIEGNIRGIEHFLTHLILMSPREKSGRRVFSTWRQTIATMVKQNSGPVSTVADEMTLNFLTKSRYGVLTKGFSSLEETLVAVEKNIILEALSKYSNQSEAAEALGMSKGGFSIKLSRLGIKNLKSTRLSIKKIPTTSQEALQ